MTSGSEHKDAAWRFVEFALGTKGQEILAQTGRTVPSLKSVAGSNAFLDPAQKPKNSQVFLDVIPTIRHPLDLDVAGDRGRLRGHSRERLLGTLWTTSSASST